MRQTYPITRSPAGDMRGVALKLAARPGGMNSTDMPCCRTTANSNLRALESEGLLIRVGGRHALRYFTSAEDAAVYRAAQLNPPMKAIPKKLIPKDRAGWGPDDPVHYPKDARGRPLYKVTTAPTPHQPTRTNTYGQHG